MSDLDALRDIFAFVSGGVFGWLVIRSLRHKEARR